MDRRAETHGNSGAHHAAGMRPQAALGKLADGLLQLDDGTVRQAEAHASGVRRPELEAVRDDNDDGGRESLSVTEPVTKPE